MKIKNLKESFTVYSISNREHEKEVDRLIAEYQRQGWNPWDSKYSGSKYYVILARRGEDGKGEFKAIQYSNQLFPRVIDITYKQAQGYEPIDDFDGLRRELGRMLLPQREGMNEASYGGAFDIADDQFFTREDVNDAAEDVLAHVQETFTGEYTIGGCWFEKGEFIVNIQDADSSEYEASAKVDMRKIKSPRDLKKYALDVASKIINQIKENSTIEESKLTETSHNQLDQRKREFHQKVRDRLGVQNLIGTRSKWTQEEVAESAELGCIDMLHSIMTYSAAPTVETIMSDRYMKEYIGQLGYDKVKEIVERELAHFKTATVKRDAFTDSEGISYSSLEYPEDTMNEATYPRHFKLGENDIQYVKVYNQFNYTIQEIRIDNVKKTFERGNFSIGHDKAYKNRQVYEDFIDELKEQGYTEIPSDYRCLRNKTRKGVPMGESTNDTSSYDVYGSWSVEFDITLEGEEVDFDALDEVTQEHIANSIKEGYNQGEIVTDDCTGWWVVRIECYLDDTGDVMFDSLDDVSQEHIADSILDGYRSGELCVTREGLTEATVKLTPDEMNDPSRISIKDMAKRANDEEATQRAEADKERRRQEASDKYAGLIREVRSLLDENDIDEASHILFKAFVPNEGKADTVAGEIVRAFNRIGFRFHNDGDYFFMGYGLETAAPSAVYLMNRYESAINQVQPIIDEFSNYLDENRLSDNYDAYLNKLISHIITDIISNPELMLEPNNDDCTRSDTEFMEDEQPRFDYDFMLSSDLREMLDADIVSNRDILYYAEDCFNWDSAYEGSSCSFDGGDYLYVEGLTYDGLCALKERIGGLTGIEDFWEELVNEHMDELDELRREDDEDDYEEDDETNEGFLESILPRNASKIKINLRNPSHYTPDRVADYTDRILTRSPEGNWEDTERGKYLAPSWLRSGDFDIEVIETDPNYKPKRTKEEFVVQGRYGHYGWEDLTTSDSYKEARADLKAYRENEPQYEHRLVTRRVPVTERLQEARTTKKISLYVNGEYICSSEKYATCKEFVDAVKKDGKVKYQGQKKDGSLGQVTKTIKALDKVTAKIDK